MASPLQLQGDRRTTTTTAAAPTGIPNHPPPPPPSQTIERLIHQQSSQPPCIHWLLSSGSPLLPSTCRHHQSAVVEGLEREAEGQWLEKMEHRAAVNNPDDHNDYGLLLPSPSPSLSLALVVVMVLSVPGPSSTPLSPALLCLHAIASQPPF